MKRLICAFLSVFLVTPCMANIHIRSEVVESVIKEKIDGTDAQVAALSEYNAQIKKAGGKNGIPAAGVWSVCKAAGWDIKAKDGELKCRDSGNTLLNRAVWKFPELCGIDKYLIDKGKGDCVDNFFSNRIIGGTSVNMLIAIGLAHEYARVKYDDKDLICNTVVRHGILDDFVQCKSLNKDFAYEFKFDSVTESIDASISQTTEAAICKMYDVKYTASGSPNQKGVIDFLSSACETTDEKLCGKINESMARFGRSTKIGNVGSGGAHTACVIKYDVGTPSDLRTVFGIDNYIFKKNRIQLQATNSIKDHVCNYVRNNVTTTNITRCTCNDGYTQLYDYSNGTTEVDDVLTCKINGNPVDFVFDDLSEYVKWEQKAGEAGMQCIIQTGGKFDGKFCRGVTKQECHDVSNKVPGGTEWDDKAAACVLKDARAAQRINNGITIGTGVIITVGTLGVGGAAAGAVLVAVAGSVAIDAAFIGLDRLNETNPHHRALQFMADAKGCDNSTCAYTIVQSHISRLDEILSELNDDELDMVSDEMGRISGLLSDEEFFNAMDSSTLKVEDYTLKAGGLGLLIASLFVSPERATERVFARSAGVAQKMGRFAEHIGIAGSHAEDVFKITQKFGKHAVCVWPKSGKISGQYYYKIFINDSDDVASIVYDLQRNGYFVSSNITEDGQKILGISNQQMFDAWDNAPTNWLKFGSNVKQVARSGKIGDELAEQLLSVLPNGWVGKKTRFFYEITRNGELQHVTGLKFHGSVVPEDLEKASYIVHDKVVQYNIAKEWKVDIDGMSGSQLGKDFTIYVSPDAYNQVTIQAFLDDLEESFRANGIRSNGFGSNIMSGDRPVRGSSYFNYRYDRTNNLGVPDGVYNDSYNFVAPRPEYGGDIMDDIMIR